MLERITLNLYQSLGHPCDTKLLPGNVLCKKKRDYLTESALFNTAAPFCLEARDSSDDGSKTSLTLVASRSDISVVCSSCLQDSTVQRPTQTSASLSHT